MTENRTPSNIKVGTSNVLLTNMKYRGVQNVAITWIVVLWKQWTMDTNWFEMFKYSFRFWISYILSLLSVCPWPGQSHCYTQDSNSRLPFLSFKEINSSVELIDVSASTQSFLFKECLLYFIRGRRETATVGRMNPTSR